MSVEDTSFADLVVSDLERQLGEPDPRYARKCRELAILRAQYAQLISFVQSKKDELGLTLVDSSGQPLPDGQDVVEPAADEHKVNGKEVHLDN